MHSDIVLFFSVLFLFGNWGLSHEWTKGGVDRSSGRELILDFLLWMNEVRVSIKYLRGSWNIVRAESEVGFNVQFVSAKKVSLGVGRC